MATRKPTFMDTLMAEVIRYGGLPVRRADVYQDAFARTGSVKAADMFAFGPRAIALDGVEPISAAELAALP